MANVENVWLIAGTGNGTNDGSSDYVTLEFNLADGQDAALTTQTANRTAKWGSKDDPGDAVIWQWGSSEISPSFSVGDILSIELEAGGNDAWLPANLFVVVEDSDSNYTMMAANGNWSGCVSKDTDDCGGDAKSEYTLYSST